MKIVVVYDTVYGNTKSIAEAVVKGLGREVLVLPVADASLEEIEAADLLVLGSPTRGALPTEAMQGLLAKIVPPRKGGRAAAFDTRLTWGFLEKWGGFAADKIMLNLSGKGWDMATRPEGFFVSGLIRVRLKRGETERAESWARSLMAAMDRE